jgi:hypothetical protein
MLESLKGGCLRIGTHTDQAFYTLDRFFSIHKQKLRETARTLGISSSGIRLYHTDRRADIAKMISVGQSAIEMRMTRHRTLKGALEASHGAGNLLPPSFDERLLQVSIGGNPDSMQVGKFIPCAGHSDSTELTVRCACGFKSVDKLPPQLQKSRGVLKKNKSCGVAID